VSSDKIVFLCTHFGNRLANR